MARDTRSVGERARPQRWLARNICNMALQTAYNLLQRSAKDYFIAMKHMFAVKKQLSQTPTEMNPYSTTLRKGSHR